MGVQTQALATPTASHVRVAMLIEPEIAAHTQLKATVVLVALDQVEVTPVLAVSATVTVMELQEALEVDTAADVIDDVKVQSI